MRTRIGVSAGILGAALYLSGLMSYFILILLAGYVLLFEQNQWLRYVAVKAVWVCFALEALSILIGLVPDFLGFFSSIAAIFNGGFSYYLVNQIVNVLQYAIELVRVVLLLMLGFKAIRQSDVSLGSLDAKIRSVLFKDQEQ